MSNHINIKVLFFATLKERTGTSHADIEIKDSATVADLLDKLMVQYPGLRTSKENMIIAVNQKFATVEDILGDGDEVAVFPPVSGGQGCLIFAEITRDPLNMDSLVEKITTPATGAACVFTGIVRGETTRGHFPQTISLEYEAYESMAKAKMEQIGREMADRWPGLQGIVLVQRIGLLTPQTPTVIIACSASHRDMGIFEAAHYGIDRLKEIVPVWKKEISPEGQVWVEGSYLPDKND
ncbi:MAG TPA: molybdopterin converting factor subunit 1 [Anaerolineaceae bacterium]|nr:molybdopterin converting factor subunit 1 [Anaerolineaceae bacterium]HPN52399.1 molybdopterin converting factor subunit 1 [Anaerolineaceae bacterium]